MTASTTGDRVLDAALTQGRRGLRAHLAWQTFAFVGMVVLAVAFGATLLVPAMRLLAAPTVPATVEYDAPGGYVFVVIDLDDGRQVRASVGGDPSDVTVPVRFHIDHPERTVTPQRLWFDVPFGLVLTGAFAAGAVISARSLQHHARALRRLRGDLDPTTRDRHRMLLTTELRSSRYGAWTTMLFTEPGEPSPRWKSRAFAGRAPTATDPLEVTVHGRIAHGGYAVVETDEGELFPLLEPLLRPLRRPGPPSSEG